jgi:hypothetical protein
MSEQIQKNGSIIQVTTTSSKNYGSNNVAMDDMGNFLVTWQEGGEGYQEMGQRFNSAGKLQTSGVLTFSSNGSNLQGSDVAMDADGDFAVMQFINGLGSTGIVQRYEATAELQGSSITLGSVLKPWEC